MLFLSTRTCRQQRKHLQLQDVTKGNYSPFCSPCAPATSPAGKPESLALLLTTCSPQSKQLNIYTAELFSIFQTNKITS